MRKLLIKVIRFFKYRVPGTQVPGSLPTPASDSRENRLYRLGYSPANEKIIGSLRSRGWQTDLEINKHGELEYVIYLETPAVKIADNRE